MDPAAVGLLVAEEAEDSAASAAAGEASVAVDRAEVGSPMRTKEFIRKLNHDRIVEAIRQAESKTSGEVRVYIQRGELDRDVLIVAQERFLSLGMQNTTLRNGVLIFVAPRMQQFAVLGDEGIHQRCGCDLWQRVVEKMGAHFKQHHYSDAIVGAIKDLGEVLGEQFPRAAGDVNELPDRVEGEE